MMPPRFLLLGYVNFGVAWYGLRLGRLFVGLCRTTATGGSCVGFVYSQRVQPPMDPTP